MQRHQLFGVICFVLFVLGVASTAEAGLEVRMGGQALYDSDLDVTWVSDAKLALTNQFGLTLSGIPYDILPYPPPQDTVSSGGHMTWQSANAWIAGMNAANYLGFNDWRLPVSSGEFCSQDFDGSVPAGIPIGFNCSSSEMGHLYYNVLGATPSQNFALGADPIELAKFANLSDEFGNTHNSWSGTEYIAGPSGHAYSFEFSNGHQHQSPKTSFKFALAVRDGDVGGAVAVPSLGTLGTFTLFSLLGLSSLRLLRRNSS